jgi:hypothetical protein
VIGAPVWCFRKSRKALRSVPDVIGRVAKAWIKAWIVSSHMGYLPRERLAPAFR